MKNMKRIILTGSMLVVGGMAYAVPTVPTSTGSLTATTLGTGSYLEQSLYREGVSSASAASPGEIYFSKENGVEYKTVTGKVTSVNTLKNVFMVEDTNAHISTTVLTDSQTISHLTVGKTVTVKLRFDSPVARSVQIAE